MLEHLFGSKTRLKLLKVFFRDTAKSYYVRELTRLVDAQINAVRRELELLVKSGLVRKIELTKKDARWSALRKYYCLNNESILYPELLALLLKAQVLGQEQFIQEVQGKVPHLSVLLLTGRFTSDGRAPTDILLVGDSISDRVVERLVEKYEKDFGSPLNYTIMTRREFEDRRQMMDKFLFSVFEAKHVKVVDKLEV